MIYINLQIRRIPLHGMQVVRMRRRTETDVWLLLPVRCIVTGISPVPGKIGNFIMFKTRLFQPFTHPLITFGHHLLILQAKTRPVSPYAQTPYLNQYLTYTRINELLANDLPSPRHQKATPPPSAPVNR